ncbi:MAG: hypothetical protein R3F30_03875 [Planctomycetota bacterium]
MNQSVACPSCSSSLGIPEGASGKKLRCPSCREVLRVFAGPEGGWTLQRLHDLAAMEAAGGAAAAATAASDEDEGIDVAELDELEPVATDDGSCPACGAEVEQGKSFCAACGAKVGEGAATPRRSSQARRHAERISGERDKHIRRTARWLIAIAVFFVVGGIGQGILGQKQADKALARFANDPPDEVYYLEDEEITVGELRDRVQLEVTLIYVVNFFLAAAMLGLYFWARGSPLPAFMTALGLYLAVIVLNAIVEPDSLYKGILIKVLIILALVKGIQAALSRDPVGRPATERVATRRSAAARRPRR